MEVGKRLYFVVSRSSHQLEYYERKDGKLLGSIRLSTRSNCLPSPADRCTFLITDVETHQRRRLQAGSAQEAQEWIEIINSVMHQADSETSSEHFEFVAHECNLRAPGLLRLLQEAPAVQFLLVQGRIP